MSGLNIYHVAMLAGVSITTVSRVINNQGVREENREKVLKVIEMYGYCPDPAAQDLGRKNNPREKTRARALLPAGALIMLFLFYSTAFAALPTLGSITPASGTSAVNSTQAFSTKYSDADGWQNLRKAYFLVSSSSSSLANAAYLYYDRSANKLYLRNDANSAWLGGYVPRSSNSVENSFMKLNCAATTVSGSGNTLTISWSVVFKSSSAGKTHNTYLKVSDASGTTVGWTKKGTWTVAANVSPPVISSITPAQGALLYNNQTISITAAVSAADLAALQYQFSIDGVVRQPWSSAKFYNCSVGAQETGAYTVKVEIKNNGGADSEEANVFLVRRPLAAPQ